MELTTAVKTLRTQVGESQQAFATKLGISIRGLVNYEKDREPPLALLLKLAAIARDTGNDNLADVFQWAFYEQIMNATRGYQISFLQEDQREDSGLVLLTFASEQFEYVSAFVTAMKQASGGEDAVAGKEARKMLDAMVHSVFPQSKPKATRKK